MVPVNQELSIDVGEEEPEEIAIDPTVTAPAPESVKAPVKAPVKEGKNKHDYWSSHEYHRQSVRHLRDDLHVGFAGHDKILDMIEKAKERGKSKYPDTEIRDGALVAFYFLGGVRKREAIKNKVTDDEGILYWYGVRKADVSYDSKLKAYVANVKVLKKYNRKLVETRDLGVDEKGRQILQKIYETERVVKIRQFPILEEEVELPAFMEWYDELGKNDYLFELSRGNASGIVEAAGGEGWFVHRLRFERATQLRQERGFDTSDLMDFFMWRSEAEARLYGGMATSDLAAKMRGEK